MKRIFLASVLFLGFAPAALAGLVYQHDNGIVGGSQPYFAGNDVIAGNWFATQPGFGTLTGITVYWGQDPGATVTLGIVDDPNGDGNLADGSLLQSINVTPGAGDIGQFVSYAIAPTAVGLGFFVGAFIEDGPGGNVPIYFDTSTGNFALGFSRAVQNSGTNTFLFLAQNAPTFPDAFWMIRANSSVPVPEPGTLALFGLGLAALAGWRRRKL